MDELYVKNIVKSNLTAREYKIVLLLSLKDYTQAELSRELGITTTNINAVVKSLKSKDIIEVGSKVGANIYLSLKK